MAEIDVDSILSAESPVPPSTVPRSPSDDDLDEVLKLMGISVHYLETVLLKEVEAAGLDRSATIAELEGLQVVKKEKEEAKEEIIEEQAPKEDDEPSVILSKGQDVLCPIDGKKGAAYVHCLLNSKSACPVGFATIRLIYANQYSIGDILDTLNDYCATNGKDPQETFVWMYCFSANLHRVERIVEEDYNNSLPAETMTAEYERLQRQILATGHVMCMLSPWKDPILLKRSWCTLELYATRQVLKEQEKDGKDSTIEVSVVFPPAQKMELEIHMLIEHMEKTDEFYKALGSTKVQLADAALHQDRNGILRFAQEQTGGRPQYNLQCNQVTRHWYRQLKQEMEQLPQHTIPQKYPLRPLTVLTTDLLAQQYAQYFAQLAILFDNNEEQEAAEEMRHRERAIRSCLDEETERHQKQLVPDKPLTYYNAATKLAEQGDCDGAILALGKTMAIFEAAYGNQHIATGTVYHRIGDMLLQKSKTEPSNKQGAMIAYKRALDVQEKQLGKFHPVTGANYLRLGLYLEARGKFDDALEYYTNGQQLLGQYVPLAVKPFLTLEKKFLLKGQDEAADWARQKGMVIRNALGIVEPEPEPEPEEGEDGKEGSESQGEDVREEAPPEKIPDPMEDLEDEEEDEPEAAPKPEVQDLLAEYRKTLAQVESASESDSDSDGVAC